ncbi:hypothetical protein [Paenibacillus wynnii]|uniref:Uncharacterized protein n=1 Tax=Paenibacillus wynnii TaxID=268407 RepID=A0A098M4A1_9BACL|nr:hypothetical protein [Paenibacillus wynnii]KGE17379.1 hypothetical protein PWYN_22485 [Paenibacillus wynnii]
MKHRIAGLLAAAITLGLMLTGCSNEQIEKEAGRYNMQTVQDGVLRAQSQGKGLNGRFLKQMRLAFAREQVNLTHERYSEDARGNISYQYLINSQPTQLITIHVFSSELELLNRVPHWYGTNQVAETSTTLTEIYNKNNASLVYTSMGENKGKYSEKIKILFTRILDRLDFPQGSENRGPQFK